jgi:hypothetical protein
MTRFLYFSVAVACVCCAACGVAQNLKNMQTQTSQAIETFHQQLGAGDTDGILASATPEFRASLPGETMNKFFLRIRKKMGTCTGWRSTQYNINANTRGTFMNLGGTTHCENGDLQENFVWVMQDAHAVLQTYSANSPQLLVD